MAKELLFSLLTNATMVGTVTYLMLIVIQFLTYIR